MMSKIFKNTESPLIIIPVIANPPPFGSRTAIIPNTSPTTPVKNPIHETKKTKRDLRSLKQLLSRSWYSSYRMYVLLNSKAFKE